MKKLSKSIAPQQTAESFVFPGTSNNREKQIALAEFLDFRKKLSEKQTGKVKATSLLLQLKFLREDDTSPGNEK